MKIYGLSFSWKRAFDVTKAKQQFAWQTGIPASKAGLERKIGMVILKVSMTNKAVHTISQVVYTSLDLRLPITGVWYISL